jgi:hypothetical protein
MATNTFTPDTFSTEPSERVRYARLWWVGLLAIVLSVAANLVVRALALTLLPIAPEFIPLSTPGPVIFFTAIGVLAAVLVFALVGRFSTRPARTYTVLAVVALVLSLIPNVLMLVNPASFPFTGINAANVVVLMVQHGVAAAVAVWVLTTQAVETTSVDA